MNKKIINAFIKNDPMGFIGMDFPEEEYNVEWNDIIFDIKNYSSNFIFNIKY